ncbi:sugar ABC transporter ATP-binding protein [Neisseriaceae bacterium JH1-16]|nr:sugar ABC transporter ATP-binding protein [Neisseriaceae bacterium JH1-16]
MSSPTPLPDATARDAVLQVRHIGKRFGATQALDQVSLTVRPGEAVALMGANGAGKSTLVKILAGVQTAGSGELLLGGLPFAPRSPREALAAGIVSVHQATEQLGVPALTVAENLLLGRLCNGHLPVLLRRGRLLREAAEVAAYIGLNLPLDAPFDDLTPAQRQLVALARALSEAARVVILDEPTASLSSREATRLFEVIDQLKARGVAVLYISHRLGDLRRIADRAVVLRNGRVAGEFAAPLDLSAAVQAMIGHEPSLPVRRETIRTAQPVLAVQDLVLRPGARPISLSLHPGEVVAITGNLGAGKSRLLQTLFGEQTWRSGTAQLDGQAWRPRSPADSIARGVFLAGEDRWRSSFLPVETLGACIGDLISFPHLGRLFPHGWLRPAHTDRIAATAIGRLGIRTQGPDDTPDLLSGGNQQKVVLARWQSQPYRLLLLDEPFQGVDVGARHDLIDAIRDRQDAATLIATSDVEEALEVADRIFVMHQHSLIEVDNHQGGAAVLATLQALETTEAAA